jgi:hypothetical protein
MKVITRLAGLLIIAVGQSCFDTGGIPLWPEPDADHSRWSLFAPREKGSRGADDDLVRELPVCVASQQWSAGELGRSVLYQFKRVGHELHVGYFVYWSTERPWGKNLLSYLVVPALVVDSFYSHLFFLLPGLQRIIHGPGDVEGARVVYQQRDDGQWMPVSAVADDGLHHEVTLDPGDFVDGQGRVLLMTDVWSHQLGAKGARAFVEGTHDGGVVCYGRNTLSPLTARIADVFRLGTSLAPRRARPAWQL